MKEDIKYIIIQQNYAHFIFNRTTTNVVDVVSRKVNHVVRMPERWVPRVPRVPREPDPPTKI